MFSARIRIKRIFSRSILNSHQIGNSRAVKQVGHVQIEPVKQVGLVGQVGQVGQDGLVGLLVRSSGTAKVLCKILCLSPELRSIL
jgi:hypothetical protein